MYDEIDELFSQKQLKEKLPRFDLESANLFYTTTMLQKNLQ